MTTFYSETPVTYVKARKIGKTCFVYVATENTSVTVSGWSGTKVCTLSSPFRPTEGQYVLVKARNSSSSSLFDCFVKITTSGEVYIGNIATDASSTFNQFGAVIPYTVASFGT